MALNKNLIIVGILVLLVIVTVVQAVQLISIKNNIDDLGTNTIVKTSSTGTKSSSTSSSSKVPTNLQNLPGMVGGC